MKAAIYTKYGPPDVLKIVEVTRPTINDDEVLIAVKVTTVNRTDEGFRSASYFVSRFFTGLFTPKQPIGGSEYTGEIVEVGENVDDFHVGDRVFGFDDSGGGGHAEYVAKKASSAIARIPDGLSYKEVAAASEGAIYALSDITVSKIKTGQNAMVYGASGAIGSAALQILKDMGVCVTAVCGTKNIDLVKKLGADKVVDYQTEDFLDTGMTYDFVFDAVGKTSYGACKVLLTKKGRYCSTELGSYGQNLLFALWFWAMRTRKVIFPIPKINKETITKVKALLEKGAYKPVIDKEYDLENIVEAATYVASGQKTGNVLIIVDKS